jgi:hypothetical protein
MDELWLLLFWSGPIGLGIFLALLGVFIWLLAKADAISKQTKAFSKEKGLDSKRDRHHQSD